MKSMLYLQWIDPDSGENVGALNVNPDHISAIYYDRRDKQTRIILHGGREFITANGIPEITEMLYAIRAEERRRERPMDCGPL